MSTEPLDAYLRRLERELRRLGFDDPRTLDEARDHLLDLIEDGRRRGLPDDDAASDAFERFGAPEIVAAHVVSEGEHTMVDLQRCFGRSGITSGGFWCPRS